ncbi:MAG: hypothetical protein RI894_1513 [Bacteroidota bacterium]|jgi:D-alanyl-D-alanine dipeptidase
MGKDNLVSFTRSLSTNIMNKKNLLSFAFLIGQLVGVAAQNAAPSGWVNIQDLDPSIKLDIRYATDNNFTKAQLYDCPACYFRTTVANAVVKVHKDLQAQGYGGLKMFDCYRPAPYQLRLWKKVPDARFVTPPQKGSMHSRGGAADLTVLDKSGNELDMGTPFDSFDKKSYQTCTEFPKNILDNRAVLRNTMEKYGFRAIRTEWWHFAYIPTQYSVADWLWCPKTSEPALPVSPTKHTKKRRKGRK